MDTGKEGVAMYTARNVLEVGVVVSTGLLFDPYITEWQEWMTGTAQTLRGSQQQT